MKDIFKMPTNNEAVILELQDLIKETEDGQNPEFVLIKFEKVKCHCPKPDCVSGRQVSGFAFNCTKTAVIGGCEMMLLQAQLGILGLKE